METLNIDKEKAINAYQQGSEEQKKVLEKVFGVETFKPKTIKDRIKTFDDALKELGEDHPFVLAYQNTNLCDPEVADDNKDVLAYLKLRIITAALNEGWTPQFVEDERRYYPYFHICSEEEIIRMSEEEKSRVVYLSDCYASALVGVSCAYASYDSAAVGAHIGSRLAFKTNELAKYAGKQFGKLYANYLDI